MIACWIWAWRSSYWILAANIHDPEKKSYDRRMSLPWELAAFVLDGQVCFMISGQCPLQSNSELTSNPSCFFDPQVFKEPRSSMSSESTQTFAKSSRKKSFNFIPSFSAADFASYCCFSSLKKAWSKSKDFVSPCFREVADNETGIFLLYTAVFSAKVNIYPALWPYPYCGRERDF